MFKKGNGPIRLYATIDKNALTIINNGCDFGYLNEVIYYRMENMIYPK